MDERTSVINGIEITDITPELTEDEIVERASYIVNSIIALTSKRDKTA